MRRSRSWSTTSSSTRRALRGLYDFRHQLLRDALYRTIPARSGAGSTPGPASSARSSRERRRSTPRSTTSGPGFRREAFEAALAGAREASRLSAHRESFELYRRAVDNMPDDLDPRRAGGDPVRAYAERGGGDRGARASPSTAGARGRAMPPARPGMPVRRDRGAARDLRRSGGARRDRSTERLATLARALDASSTAPDAADVRRPCAA